MVYVGSAKIKIVKHLAPWAPITNNSSISAVLDGPVMNAPYPWLYFNTSNHLTWMANNPTFIKCFWLVVALQIKPLSVNKNLALLPNY